MFQPPNAPVFAPGNTSESPGVAQSGVDSRNILVWYGRIHSRFTLFSPDKTCSLVPNLPQVPNLSAVVLAGCPAQHPRRGGWTGRGDAALLEPA